MVLFQLNPKRIWLLVNEKGEVLEKFRCKRTAVEFLSKLRKDHPYELKVVAGNEREG